MYYIELETGLRRGELLGLKWHDIDWKNRIIKAMRSIALLNGVDIKTVSGMLGHFSAGFTLDTYAHVTTSAQKEATETMGNLLSI